MKAIQKCLVACIFLTWFGSIVLGLDLSRMRIAHPSGAGEIFHGGVYIYSTASTTDAIVEPHIRMMSQQGFTHLYVATSTVTTPDEVIQWCRKYKCYVSFQHDYLTAIPPTQAMATSAANYINNVLDDPEYLTSSVKEEPTTAYIDALLDAGGYYQMINTALGTTAPFYLLHNNYIEYASQKSFKPFMTGIDRTYLYIWVYDVTVNGKLGYLLSPRKALNVMNTYLHNYSAYIDSSCQWSVATLTGFQWQTPKSKAYLESTYGTTAYQRWLSLAQYNGGEGNQGLKESGNNILNCNTYIPPANCMSCQTWLAVARGYRTVFAYHGTPADGTTCKGLMGPSFKGTAQLDEYGATVRELQKFGWTINHMEYQPSSAYISYTDSPQFTTYSGGFTIPGYNGKIAVLVNADVGTWCGTSPLYFTDAHVFRFDSDGFVNPSDYTAKTSLRSISVTNNVPSTDMYDLETGALIGSSSGSIDVAPGKGKFIFIGNSAELTEIRAKCGMTTITTHSGLVPNRETVPDNKQIFYAVDPKISNSQYQLSNTTISRNKRYRLHVAAQSSTNAQLGALASYYDNNTWYTSSIQLAAINSTPDNTNFWNKTLTATPATFVSRDFTVSAGTAAAVFLYRSNSSGTIQINDAWVEDCDSHREIAANTTWMDNAITHPVSNGEIYQVYARVRNYPAYGSKCSVKICEYDSNDSLLGEYNTTPAIVNQTLSADPTVFKGTFQKNNQSAHHVRVKFINSTTLGPVMLESACVGQIVP